MQPLLSSQVSLNIGIYNPSENCLLYEENQVIDLSSSDGFFSINVGSNIGDQKRTSNDPGLSLSKIFSNSSNITGSGSCAYTPSAGDIRKLKVTVSTGSSSHVLPSQEINSTPNANIAESLQGLGPNDIIQVITAVGLTQQNVEKLVNGSDVGNLHNHDSRYIQQGSSPSFQKVSISDSNYVPSSNGDVITKLYSDSTFVNSSTYSNDKNSINSTLNTKYTGDDATIRTLIGVTPNSPLSYSLMTGLFSLNVGTSSWSVAAGNDSRIVGAFQSSTSLGGDLSGTLPNPSVSKLNGTPLSTSSLASGQLLKYNGTNWTNSTLTSSDISDWSSVTSSFSSKENPLTFSSPLRSSNKMSCVSTFRSHETMRSLLQPPSGLGPGDFRALYFFPPRRVGFRFSLKPADEVQNHKLDHQ